jgi:hypothetical protein
MLGVAAHLEKFHDGLTGGGQNALNKIGANTMKGNLVNDRLLVLGKDGIRKTHEVSIEHAVVV